MMRKRMRQGEYTNFVWIFAIVNAAGIKSSWHCPWKIPWLSTTSKGPPFLDNPNCPKNTRTYINKQQLFKTQQQTAHKINQWRTRWRLRKDVGARIVGSLKEIHRGVRVLRARRAVRVDPGTTTTLVRSVWVQEIPWLLAVWQLTQ